MGQFEKWVQERLIHHGAKIKADGDWGKESIAALQAFQSFHRLPVTGVTDKNTLDALKQPFKGIGVLNPTPPVTPPSEKMPPWMSEMHRKMGLHEVRHNKSLIDWLKFGKYLGNPKDLPWCGDAVETCFAKTLPNEPLPSNPFFAQNWAKFGKNVGSPIVGAVGVIRWSANSGHVGFVAGTSGSTVYMLGGNQSNEINITGFGRSKFMAFTWPKTYPVRQYPALKGVAAAVVGTEGGTR